MIKKHWLQDSKDCDKIIILTDDKIYRSNPDSLKYFEYVEEIKMGKIPREIFSVPLSAISGIEMPENKNRIVIYCKNNSYEYLNVNDTQKKNEIFTYLRNEIPNTNYELIPYNWKQDSKPLRNAAIVFTILLSISFPFSLMFENGNLAEGQYPVFLLFLVGLGTKKLMGGYLIIMLFIAIRVYLKAKIKTESHWIHF